MAVWVFNGTRWVKIPDGEAIHLGANGCTINTRGNEKTVGLVAMHPGTVVVVSDDKPTSAAP